MRIDVSRTFRPAVTSAALALTLTVAAAAQGQRAAGPAPAQSQIERGRYLVTIQDCHGCHTPFDAKGQPDMSRVLSGHPADVKVAAPPRLSGGWLVAINTTNTAWSGPWGVSYTTNLTPDRATGIGAWTEQNFIDAIRKGRKAGVGRPLLPPMPWPNYAKMTDDDLKAMFAFLRSIPPIRNAVPAAVAAAPAP
jgi:mono/diheme cytochrome c family protein